MRETAAAVLIDPAGRIVLGLRASWKRVAPGLWDALGGGIEIGETPEAALLRELREELGIEATCFRAIEVMREPRPELHGEALYHLFVVTAWAGVPRNASNEHDEIRWFSAQETALLPNRTDLPERILAGFRQS